jgi:hypothetical protein
MSPTPICKKNRIFSSFTFRHRQSSVVLFVFWSPLQVVDDGEDKNVNVLSLLVFIKTLNIFGCINFNIFLSNTSIV